MTVYMVYLPYGDLKSGYGAEPLRWLHENLQGKYVVDVARYPIGKGDYVIVNGLKVAKQEFVLRGKSKQQVGRKLFRTIRIPRVNVRKFL